MDYVDEYVTCDKSAYSIIRELTGTKSVMRVHGYADIFKGSYALLGRYFSLCEGGDGEVWQFHVYDSGYWVLREWTTKYQSLRDLVFFAYYLRQPYTVAAAWARVFIPGSVASGQSRLPIPGNKLRPFLEAGMSPEETAALLYNGLPSGHDSPRGRQTLDARLKRTRQYTDMYRSGFAIEYITALEA
jgi:hypothetical protein